MEYMEYVDEVLVDVYNERARQENLVGVKFDWTAAHPQVTADERLRILVEEVGEVARAIHERADLEHLYEEFVQVAAIAVASAESIRAVVDPFKLAQAS